MQKKDLSPFIISEPVSVLETMQIINENNKGVAFLCDGKILKAVVTDGDVRRHILKHGDLQASVDTIANHNPISLPIGREYEAKVQMRQKNINAIPIVDKNNEIDSIIFLAGPVAKRKRDINIPVTVMAGGKGTRLSPYTNILPKPLIPVGEKTILEEIIQQFRQYNCNDFFLVTNYKKNLIRAFLQDAQLDCHIEFIEEMDFMGTGGGLALLRDHIHSTFFVTNCDVLINTDFKNIYEYHKKHNNIITIVCAIKKSVLPYGVVDIDESGTVKALREKPTTTFMTNAGVYIVEPRFLDYIPPDTHIHITDAIQKCINARENVGAYPISESAWMDMGQMDSLEDMRRRIKKLYQNDEEQEE